MELTVSSHINMESVSGKHLLVCVRDGKDGEREQREEERGRGAEEKPAALQNMLM